MTTKRLAAVFLSLGALGTAGAGTAQAVEGSATLPGPGGCDLAVFWNTDDNPMAGATVPHYNECLKPVYEALDIGT